MSLNSVDLSTIKRSRSPLSSLESSRSKKRREEVVPLIIKERDAKENEVENEVGTFIDVPTVYYEDIAVQTVKKMRQKVVIGCIEWFTQSVAEGKEDIGAVLVLKGATPADVTHIKEHRIYGEILKGAKIIEENGRLILIQLPLLVHQCAVSRSMVEIANQLDSAAPDVFTVSGNISRAGEFGGRQPDVIIFPCPAYIPEFVTHKDAGATRVAIEIEVSHRSVPQCRVEGMYLFNNSSLLRALIIIKMYSTSAIAVVYHRNPLNDNVELLEAVSFGRENLCDRDTFFWTTDTFINHPGPLLPPIPIGINGVANITSSLLLAPPAISPAATIQIPAWDVWYQIRSTPNGPYLNMPLLMMPEMAHHSLQLDLRKIGRALGLYYR